ncbi:hypothetical protein MASR1M6_02560 [Rubrivivax sp.]
MRLRQIGPALVGESLDGFANDQQVEEHGVLGRLVVEKVLQFAARDATSDLLGAGDQIVQIEDPVTRHG